MPRRPIHLAQRLPEPQRTIANRQLRCGWSFGGTVAHAMACQLQQEGESVPFLTLLDTYPSSNRDASSLPTQQELLIVFAEQFGLELENLGTQPLDVLNVIEASRRAGHVLPGLDAEQAERMLGVIQHHTRLMVDFQPDRFEGDMLLFMATEDRDSTPSPSTWKSYVTGDIAVHEIACRHADMSLPAPLSTIGRLVEQHLRSLT